MFDFSKNAHRQAMREIYPAEEDVEAWLVKRGKMDELFAQRGLRADYFNDYLELKADADAIARDIKEGSQILQVDYESIERSRVGFHLARRAFDERLYLKSKRNLRFNVGDYIDPKTIWRLFRKKKLNLAEYTRLIVEFFDARDEIVKTDAVPSKGQTPALLERLTKLCKKFEALNEKIDRPTSSQTALAESLKYNDFVQYIETRFQEVDKESYPDDRYYFVLDLAAELDSWINSTQVFLILLLFKYIEKRYPPDGLNIFIGKLKKHLDTGEQSDLERLLLHKDALQTGDDTTRMEDFFRGLNEEVGKIIGSKAMKSLNEALVGTPFGALANASLTRTFARSMMTNMYPHFCSKFLDLIDDADFQAMLMRDYQMQRDDINKLIFRYATLENAHMHLYFIGTIGLDQDIEMGFFEFGSEREEKKYYDSHYKEVQEALRKALRVLRTGPDVLKVKTKLPLPPGKGEEE